MLLRDPLSAQAASPLEAPRAPRRPKVMAKFGDRRVDDYFWLRDKSDPEVIAYLQAENAYGREVAGRLVGKGFVVDTSRNGRGPAPGGEWCNPAGRGLGAPPAIAPGGGPDANLWIKRPGESDGTCNGGPAAGVFWPTYAIGLAQRAAGAG